MLRVQTFVPIHVANKWIETTQKVSYALLIVENHRLYPLTGTVRLVLIMVTGRPGRQREFGSCLHRDM